VSLGSDKDDRKWHSDLQVSFAIKMKSGIQSCLPKIFIKKVRLARLSLLFSCL